MRVALISDIHGNFTALEAVLSDIRHRCVETTICLGDTASIGPQPLQVLNILKKSECLCIMGNHDKALLNPDKALELKIPEHLVPTLEWSLKEIAAEGLAYLRSFRKTITVRINHELSILCYHGSPESCADEIRSTTAESELETFFAVAKEKICAGGHTHQQMRRDFKDTIIINPGSVGTVFKSPPGEAIRLQPWAEYAIVDATRHAIDIEMHQVHFDPGKAIEGIRQSSSPLKQWWLKQYASILT